MKKMINKAHVEGRVMEHSLELRKSKAGVDYIGGKIVVATDEAAVNTVPVEIIYVTPTNKNGGANKNYEILNNLINNGKTVLADGKDNATMIKIDTNLGVNDWYKEENGEHKLITAKRLAGGFVHSLQALNADEGSRNTFEADMVITNTVLLEGDDEKGTVDKLLVKGCVFDYKGGLLPMEFSVTNANGIKYFESNLDVSPAEPVFTKVWGKLVNEVVINTITEESAFGEPVVKEIKKEKKDWVITGMSKEPYEFDEEGILTSAELKECISNREIHLADVLQKQLAREAAAKDNNSNKGNGAFGAGNAPANGGFTF